MSAAAKPAPAPAPAPVPDAPSRTRMQRLLDAIERAGNKVPHPVVIFLYLIAAVFVLSAVLDLLGVAVTEDVLVPDSPRVVQAIDLGGTLESTGLVVQEQSTTYRIETQTVAIRSLLSVEGIRFVFTSFVDNFANFTVVALVDIIMTGALPKWAILAPIFIPLFMQLGVAPQTVLAAYRLGDSPFNVVTPLMVYLPFVVLVAQKYVKSTGLGTIIALMIPYTVAVLIAWLILFALWYGLGLPLGPGYPVQMG